jgi:hypothetical protein
MTDQVQGFAQSISRARCAEAPTIDGARCDDVKGELIHISLAKLPPSAAQDRLLRIPTGLTIAREDVDLLIAAGESAIIGSAQLRTFLAATGQGKVLPVGNANIKTEPPRSIGVWNWFQMSAWYTVVPDQLARPNWPIGPRKPLARLSSGPR